MEIYRKKSKLGLVDFPITDIKPTQFQLYLDRIFDPENQEGILGLIRIILEDGIISPLPKQDAQGLANRRKNKYFSDLIRLVVWGSNSAIYAIAGNHRLASFFIAHKIYQTRNYIKSEEYDLAKISNLNELRAWRKDEFVLQKIKGSNVGKPYEVFDIRKYQKGFDIQFTAKYGGKRIFVKKYIESWEDLIKENTPVLIRRLKTTLSRNWIKNKEEILIAKDIIHFLDKNL